MQLPVIVRGSGAEDILSGRSRAGLQQMRRQRCSRNSQMLPSSQESSRSCRWCDLGRGGGQLLTTVHSCVDYLVGNCGRREQSPYNRLSSRANRRYRSNKDEQHPCGSVNLWRGGCEGHNSAGNRQRFRIIFYQRQRAAFDAHRGLHGN